MANDRSLDPEQQDATTSLPSNDSSPTVSLEQTGTHAFAAAKPGASNPQSAEYPIHADYEINTEIARGGMGRVLAGREIALDREVAIKTLLPGADSARFVTEARITAQLPHPGIPPVYALGNLADGAPFLAMKLVKGTTLAQALDSRLDPKDDLPFFVQIFQQIAQAVGFAHARGIIHRDLKPANIMIGAFGEVQVMDWGLAKDVADREVSQSTIAIELPDVATIGTGENPTVHHGAAEESTYDQTRVGTVLGTPAYMAPEQARGEVADARSDVFALGGILCAILTGHPPFRAKTSRELIQRAANADLKETSDRLDGCGADAELTDLCRHCLCPDPGGRPANGQAVSDALTAYLHNVQERLQAAERERAVAVAREVEQRKRRRVQSALAAAVVLILLGGAVFSWWRYEQVQTMRDREERNGQAVAELVTQCEKALHAGNTTNAQVALDAARKRSVEGGAELQTDRIKQLETDLALLRDMDEIDRFRWTWTGSTYPHPAIVANRIRAALERYGADFDGVSVDSAVLNMSNSPIRDRIVLGLDQLLQGEQKSAGARAMLRQVDANPYRDAVRDALFTENDAKFVELVGETAALQQPAGFATVLGYSGLISNERWRQVLNATVSREPENLGLLMSLGTSCAEGQAGAPERLRWFQAAVAAAPTNSAAHNNLGVALNDMGQSDMAVACWQRAILLDPKLANAQSNLGGGLLQLGQIDEAFEHYQLAINLDPKDAGFHTNLGVALYERGRYDEAISAHREAIALDPKHAPAHTNLGNALARTGQMAEAIECYKQAIALDPRTEKAHTNLGNQFARAGQLTEAIASYEEAISLGVADASTHTNLGIALMQENRMDEAINSLKQAVALNPKHGSAYNILGSVMWQKGQLDEAIDYFHQAVACGADPAQANCNLGAVLGLQGRFAESLEAYRKGHEWGSSQPDWRHPSAEWVRSAEEKAAMETKLPAFLRGEYQPSESKECLILASVCSAKKFYRAATELYIAAFGIDPDSEKPDDRYRAACSAALAAAGKGDDGAELEEADRTRFIKLALEWLATELTQHQQQLKEGQPADRAIVERTLRHWTQDSDLASIRDATLLAELPPDESAACAQLWANVAATLEKARDK